MTKKETKSKEPIRATQAQIHKYVLRIIELMGKDYTSTEICRIIMQETNKKERQVNEYIRKAMVVIKDDFNREAELKRIEMLESLRSNLKNATNIFNLLEPEDRQKSVWYKLILETKDRIAKFTPDDIESKEETPTEINFNFNTVTRDDIDNNDE